VLLLSDRSPVVDALRYYINGYSTYMAIIF
jgi:hypothetical protein